MSDGGINYIKEEIRDAEYFEMKVIELAERVSDLEEIVGQIRTLVIDAYKKIEREKNDK